MLFKFLFDLILKIKTILQRVIGILKAIGKGLKAAAAYVVCLVSSAVFAGIKVLTKLLLDLLAAAFGLSGLKDAIKKLIQKFQELVMRLLARIAKFLGLKKKMGKGCGKKGMDCGPGKVGKDGKGCPVPPMKGMAGKPGGQRPKFSLKCNTGQCFRGSEPTSCDVGQVPISAIGFESLVETWRPGEVGYEQSRARANTMIGVNDRIVWMLREDAEGHWSKVGLRRSVGWLEALGGRDVGVGDWVELNLPEMGATGDYQVMSIEPAPAVRAGEGSGRPVTGLFQFSHGDLYNLSISGQGAPIGVTENHPIWSVDRADWVPARDLQIGDRVLTRDGPANVTGFEYAGEEPVFNLEVDGDHCYRVGELGLLVHNASAPKYGPTKSIPFTDSNGNMVTAVVGTKATITLTKDNVGGTRANLDIPAWWEKLKAVAGFPIHKGHILASQLGGKETGPSNLTPLYSRPNTPAMSTCEGFIRDLVDKCMYCVELEITVNGYGQNANAPPSAKPIMPKSITIKWSVVGMSHSGVFVIENDPQIMTQDPCRVKNLPCK